MVNTISQTEGQNTGSQDLLPRIGQFLEDYGEIATILPVLAGLFVTSRLQLRGAQALFVNLAIAAMTRQTVLQLKKQAQLAPAHTAPLNGQSSHATAPAQEEDYTIVHSTAGRLRLRIPRLRIDSLYVKQLDKLLAADARVKGIRINRAAASIVIHYDPTGVSELDLGMRLLQILEQAEKAPADAQGDPAHDS